MKIIVVIENEAGDVIRRIEANFARHDDEAEAAQIVVDKISLYTEAKLRELEP